MAVKSTSKQWSYLKPTALLLIFLLHANVSWLVFAMAALTFNGAFTAAVLVLMYLFLLIISAYLIDSVKVWAIAVLPIQLVFCLYRMIECVVLSVAGHMGVTVFGLEMPDWLELPTWTGYLFTFAEIVVIQALGIGIRALARTIKRKWNEAYGGIPF